MKKINVTLKISICPEVKENQPLNKLFSCLPFTSNQLKSLYCNAPAFWHFTQSFIDEMHFFWWLNLQFVFVRMQLQLPTLDCNSDFFDKVNYILCSVSNLEMAKEIFLIWKFQFKLINWKIWNYSFSCGFLRKVHSGDLNTILVHIKV